MLELPALIRDPGFMIEGKLLAAIVHAWADRMSRKIAGGAHRVSGIGLTKTPAMATARAAFSLPVQEHYDDQLGDPWPQALRHRFAYRFGGCLGIAAVDPLQPFESKTLQRQLSEHTSRPM